MFEGRAFQAEKIRSRSIDAVSILLEKQQQVSMIETKKKKNYFQKTLGIRIPLSRALINKYIYSFDAC